MNKRSKQYIKLHILENNTQLIKLRMVNDKNIVYYYLKQHGNSCLENIIVKEYSNGL